MIKTELKTIATIAALGALAAFGMTHQGPAPAPKPTPTIAPVPHSAASIKLPASVTKTEPFIPPCAQEDSINCYWDAKTRGNGKGTSFINWKGTTYYAK